MNCGKVYLKCVPRDSGFQILAGKVLWIGKNFTLTGNRKPNPNCRYLIQEDLNNISCYQII